MFLSSTFASPQMFIFSITMITIVVCVWMFELDVEAAAIQEFANIVVVLVFGCKILFSLISYGMRYVRSLVFALELTIVLLDTISLIASAMTIQSPDHEEAIVYFVMFGAFIVLHSVRIFHIFYATARPPPLEEPQNKKTGDKKISSITGIWISRNYSAMSYAAPDLEQTVHGLPKAFSLHLYATRDKPEDVEKVNPFRGHGSHFGLHAGRPDWEGIMYEALEKAHRSQGGQGGSVGIFFCGSPAIARTLQRVAQTVTAEYQHEQRLLGNPHCHSRLLVHKENF